MRSPQAVAQYKGGCLQTSFAYGKSLLTLQKTARRVTDCAADWKGKQKENEMEDAVATLLVIVVYFVFWMFQFVQMMMLADKDFPGRYDKVLWCISFLTLFFITPFAFMYWKRAYLLVLSDSRPPRGK